MDSQIQTRLETGSQRDMSAVFTDTRKSHAFLPPENVSNMLQDAKRYKCQGLFGGGQKTDVILLHDAGCCQDVIILPGRLISAS